ncbi:hypothetical protein K488DRAFT_82745 [Vararia minispora EC-137]|uniref:Uncharacterized protein n=1 Tax=Vararia minispora EC-137 TaxID=1314806 RepID=A0ACB8QVY2_9AGAM|nr:hypothetical protein K488DRAFT_82745 [Vararia minispora EC-137]
MKTPFLVIRFVLFALLGYHSVLAVALSAWNILAAKHAGVFVSSGAVLLIFNACFFFLWMTLAFVEYIGQRANRSASVVAYECVWAGLMSVLDLAAGIAVVLGGPPVYCQKNVPYDLCASSTILVPVSWFAGIIMLSYFLTILGLSVGHMRSEPGVWLRSLYDVPWFDADRVSKYPPCLPPVNRHESTRFSFIARRHSTSSLPAATERQPTTSEDAPQDRGIPYDKPLPLDPPPLNQRTDVNDPNRPWWSRYRMRPGVDLPFAVRFSSAILPRNASRPTVDKRQRDAEAGAGADIFGDFGQLYANFSPGERQPTQRVPDSAGTLDYDKPVPRPPRSEWVRADGTVAPARPKYGSRF